MPAGRYDFSVDQGATFERTLRWTDEAHVPVSLAGKTARMQVRETPPSGVIVLELTTENGRITLVDPGRIDLFIDSLTTAALVFTTASYDLEIVDASSTPERVTRLLQGQVSLSKEVTRP